MVVKEFMVERWLIRRLILLLSLQAGFLCSAQTATTIFSLDGTWSLALDSANVGREQRWFERAQVEGAKPAKVPWIIQEAFPEYHGVVWYTREFDAPTNPHPGGRCLLRFWQVDYLAEVWLNGVKVGGHEGGETPFVIDVTDAVKPGAKNRLTVRVLNPTDQPIDGITLLQTARRSKVQAFEAGAAINHGGITESVELLCLPGIYPEDLFASASFGPTQGVIRVRAEVRNSAVKATNARVGITVSSARSGETAAVLQLDREFPPGMTPVDAELAVSNPHLWNLSDPHLYRVTVRVGSADSASFAEVSARCGFREFRFTDGYFRLNGKRIYPKSAHTCNHFPIGIQLSRDPDMLSRDLLNLKVMGFNMVRFIWGGATRAQLDLCDEIGLLVYEESYAAVPLELSPQMGTRFDAAVLELIRRDRNHPSVVMWGLLNETRDTPVFRHAVGMLPRVRALDPTRLVMLNSGRWDENLSLSVRGTIAGVSGFKMWARSASSEPWVAVNANPETVRMVGITWPAGHLALHPGPANELSVVRWTAVKKEEVEIACAFAGLATPTTTDVHVLHNGKAVFDGSLNLGGAANEAKFNGRVSVSQGDTLDFVVGSGNGGYAGDTTGLTLAIKTAEKVYDAAADFSDKKNGGGVWSYGWLAPAAAPSVSTLTLYPEDGASAGGPAAVGTLANPWSDVWEDSLGDFHCYPRSPHLAGDISMLRARDGGKGRPLFLSEYGVGSAVDLWRAVRHFEQEGAEQLEDAKYFRDKLDRFMADWKQWRLDEAFARPEDFFMESLKKMAGQRTLGLNAIRANPHIVAYNLTGAIDHVMCGEGLTTLFRELKPGTIDAMFDAWYPLRWCLFAEPAHMARGGKVHLEAVLADEGVLAPGDYPVRLQVIGPHMTRVMDRTVTVTVSGGKDVPEQPFAKCWFAEDVAIEGAAGEYQFLASFERGAAAAGGKTSFFISDRAALPPVKEEIVFWGEDSVVTNWLAERGVRFRPFGGTRSGKPEVILAGLKPESPGGATAFRELAKRIAAGSSVIFLAPEVFALADQSTRWLPLVSKGSVMQITPGWGGLYLKDEWNKSHPIFDGLPSGGLMDYTYYRDIIPDLVFVGQSAPSEAVAGAIKASQGYASGLTVAVYPLGKGRFILNTLRIRENLTAQPSAGRILLNMLNDAGKGMALTESDLPVDFEQHLDEMGYK